MVPLGDPQRSSGSGGYYRRPHKTLSWSMITSVTLQESGCMGEEMQENILQIRATYLHKDVK